MLKGHSHSDTEAAQLGQSSHMKEERVAKDSILFLYSDVFEQKDQVETGYVREISTVSQIFLFDFLGGKLTVI